MAAPNDALNNSISDGDVLRFNKSLTSLIEYNHGNSEFHKMVGFRRAQVDHFLMFLSGAIKHILIHIM